MNAMPHPNSNPEQSVCSLAPGVEFSIRSTGDQTSYVAFHAGSGRYFRFGAEEHHVATLIDGNRNTGDIYETQRADGIGWSQEDVVGFIAQLAQHKLVTVLREERVDANRPTPDQKHGTEPAPPQLPSLARITSVLSLLVSQRFPILSGQRVATKFESSVGWSFSFAGTAAWVVLTLSSVAVVYGHWHAFQSEVQRMFDPGLWPILIAIWLVAKVIHEIGHAVAAHRQRVRIGDMGVMFFLFAPLAYVDVTDAWKLKSRTSRVQIALAGVYLELAIASVAAWAWWFLPDGLLRHLCAQVFLIAGPTTLLVNANPLLRLDGYYVLSDLLEIPNLRMHGRRQLGGLLERFLIGTVPQRPLLSGWRRPAATMHAAASVVFQFFWMGGLILAVSLWARGLGVVLGFVAFMLWGAIPLGRWVYKIWMLEPPDRFWMNTKRRRLLTLAGVVFVCVQYLSVTTSPLDRRVPVVVRFHNEQISRAVADAFVSTIYVEHGQRVERGDVLVELSQPELVLSRDEMADDLHVTRQLSVQHRRNGRIALADAKSQEAESLQRRIREIDVRIGGLKIVAERDGLITTPNTHRLIGRYVNQGDELIRVSDPSEKEILAAIGERDMRAYQLAVQHNQPTRVRLRGGTHFLATPMKLRPRARRRLPHPAMSAIVGGPLAVEPSSDPNQPVRLVQPKLESVTPLDPVTSASISAGQLGAMTISDNRSFVARLFDAIEPKKR